MSEVDSSAPVDSGADGGDDASEGMDPSQMPIGLSDVAREFMANGESKGKSFSKKNEAAQREAANADPVSEQEDGDEASPEEDDAPPPKRSWKAKANGKEYEVPEDRVQDELQRGYAARQRLEEVNQLKSQIEAKERDLNERMARLEKSPEEYLRKHKDIAEKLLLEDALEWQKMQDMTPGEQRLYQEKKAYEEKLKGFEAREKEEASRQEEALVSEQRGVLEKQFTEALTVHNIPKTVLSMRVMAGVVRAAAQKGVDISMKEAAELTNKQLKAVADATYGAMSPEQFVSHYPDLAEGVRKHYAAKATRRPAEVGDVRPQPRQAQPQSGERKPNGQFKPAASQEKWEKELADLKRQGDAERFKNKW